MEIYIVNFRNHHRNYYVSISENQELVDFVLNKCKALEDLQPDCAIFQIQPIGPKDIDAPQNPPMQVFKWDKNHAMVLEAALMVAFLRGA